MTKFTIFQAGCDIVAEADTLWEAVEIANDNGFNIGYDDIQMFEKSDRVDGKIYFTENYDLLMSNKE